MLRFFEPDAEPRWPVSDAPPDHYKCSRMCDDAVFPLRSPSLLASFGGSNIESRARGSGVASELERLNSYNDDFHSIVSQDCDSFQCESMNQIAGHASLTVNSEEFRVSGLTSHQNLMVDMKRSRKHTITSHQMKKEQMMMGREPKRYKTANIVDKQQTPTIYPTTKESPITVKRRSLKLGDKITALQQLVSPFGKTDTASVLQEACAFIRLLHEQIQLLSSPYFGARNSPCFQGNVGHEKLSLRDKGLCLVPISSTIMNLTDQESFDRRSDLDRTAGEIGIRLN